MSNFINYIDYDSDYDNDSDYDPEDYDSCHSALVIQKQMIVNVKTQKMILKNGFKHREKNYLKKYILDLIRESGYNYRVME